MTKTATIPVRLSGDIIERLDNYAETLSISRSAAIRLCLAYQLGVIESADPRELPNLDGRTHRYSKTEEEFVPVALNIPPKKKPAREQARKESA